MQENSLFMNHYLIEHLLGSGGFGTVYKTTHTPSQKSYAIKIDKKRKGNVKQEHQILLELQSGEGIPTVYEAGETEEFTYMIMELLGHSLSNYQKQQGGKFSVEAVVPLLIQCVDRVEFIHSKGIVHRDLKPQQFLMGKNNTLYLVDFGLARKFMINDIHIPYQGNCSRAGNSTYASLSNHAGVHQTRRDDIESLSYMSISLLIGRLPWQQSSKLASNIKWDNVYTIKSGINLHELCRSCPIEFLNMIQYARSLRFEEKPDYEYLKRLISKALTTEELVEFTEIKEPKKKVRKNRREDSSNEEFKGKNVFILYKSKKNKN